MQQEQELLSVGTYNNYMRRHTLHKQSMVGLCAKPIIYVSRICRIKKRVSSLYILITHVIMSQYAGGDDHKLIH